MLSANAGRACVGTSIVATLSVLTGFAACGGGGAGTVPPPVSPEAVVQEFLNAVRAGSLATMSGLWGNERGPAAGNMARDEVERRLTVIRIYLEHERFEILPPDPSAVGVGGRRQVRVRITRRGCQPVVPFTVTRWRDGWLVADIDLAAAGNPQRACPAGGGG
jgi:hypothetical protein